MKAIATKQPTNESVKQNKSGEKGRSRSVSPLSTGMPLLQRKCACGGGCPRCQDELGIQTKLKIGEPGDKYEQEADRIADEVMRMPQPSVQRQVELEEEEEETLQAKPMISQITPIIQRQVEPEEEEKEEIIQTKQVACQSSAVTPSFEAKTQSLQHGGGRPLPPNTRAFMEPRFGHDFSKVRIHTDPKAARLAYSLNAKAFTMGKDIVFAKGSFDQNSLIGKSLLAHELTHYIQQEGNIVGNKNNISKHSPKLQGRLIQRKRNKVCDPLAPKCPSGTACSPTGSSFECLPTDERAFEKLVKKILNTNKPVIKETDEKELKEFIDKDPSPDRLKKLEKIIVLWPRFGNIGKKARIIELVTAPVRKTDLEESQRGRFSEKEGSEIKAELDEAMYEQIRLEKEKILKENKNISVEDAQTKAEETELNSCLQFLSASSLPKLYADQEERLETAKSRYKQGAAEREEMFKNKKPIHAKTLSRLASELRLQALVGPVHILKWEGSHEKGNHAPEPAVLFDRLSSAGAGWYFFLVNLVSFHTFTIGVHVFPRGTERKYFEIQGGQSVEKTPAQLKIGLIVSSIHQCLTKNIKGLLVLEYGKFIFSQLTNNQLVVLYNPQCDRRLCPVIQTLSSRSHPGFLGNDEVQMEVVFDRDRYFLVETGGTRLKVLV
jgi:hypothetical protein